MNDTNKKPVAPHATGSSTFLLSRSAKHRKDGASRHRLQAPLTGIALLREAHALAAVGFKPIPMIGKRPARRGWRESASRDPHEVTAAFHAARHADALGVATGAGHFVVDLDRGHANGADGVQSFSDLIARYGDGEPLPQGPRVRTPSGGWHFHFASPTGVHIGNKAAFAPGVDIRGEGGVAVVPPSSRGGVAYVWEPTPWSTSIPAAPAWLLDLVSKRPAPLRTPLAERMFSGEMPPYSRAALHRECAEVAGSAPGTRNATLFKAAASLGELAAAGALSFESVALALVDAASVCGLVTDDGMHSVEATIASGFRHGRDNPRPIPERGR